MKAQAVTKVKFKLLKRRLKLAQWQAIGVLETLWRVTEANTPSGDIGRLTDEEIAAAFEWDGSASDLVDALVDCRWLDRDDEFRLVVHDWDDHCPTSLKGALAKHGKQFANHVARQRAEQTKGQAASQGASLPNHTIPNLTEPNQTTVCGETGKPSQPQPDSEPAVLEFPCDGTPSAWLLSASQVSQWESLFPSLDIVAECRKALAWVLAESTRRKTARGMPKFLVNWFGNSQNRGAGRAVQQSRPRAIRSIQ